ncbi:MAG: hypothetical protein IK015_12325 [Treponema sp.]|nr:hypothetical protein [Treponema sp.]
MKKLILFAALMAAVLSLATAKKAKQIDPYDDKKMHPTDRSGLEKFLGTNRYEVLDEAGIYIKPLVGKIKAKRGNFIYRRGTDVAGYRVYYDTTAYTVEMAKETRQICCDAIDRYMDDFANKRLDRKAKLEKSRRVYGSAPGYQEFGVAISMMNYKAKPTFYFGYAFVDGSPYFVIHSAKAKNLTLEGKHVAETPNMETIPQNYFFTRAQAQRLKEFICEENISLFHDEEEKKLGGLRADAENDEYTEADSTIPEKKKKAKKAKKADPEGDAYDDAPAEEDITPINTVNER